MSSIRIFDFILSVCSSLPGDSNKKSTSASSQYWQNCDVRCYSYRIKNDCVVFVRRRLLLFSLFWPLRGRSKNWRESSDPDPFFTRVVFVKKIREIKFFANTFIVPSTNFAALEQRLLRKFLRLALTTYRQLFRWWHRLGTDFTQTTRQYFNFELSNYFVFLLVLLCVKNK